MYRRLSTIVQSDISSSEDTIYHKSISFNSSSVPCSIPPVSDIVQNGKASYRYKTLDSHRPLRHISIKSSICFVVSTQRCRTPSGSELLDYVSHCHSSLYGSAISISTDAVPTLYACLITPSDDLTRLIQRTQTVPVLSSHSTMRYSFGISAAALSLVSFATPGSAFFRVPCPGRIVTERADPIVSPGSVSGHVHTISGGLYH